MSTAQLRKGWWQTLTFDLHKVGSNKQGHKGAASLAVHGHAVCHALAHDDCAVHDHNH